MSSLIETLYGLDLLLVLGTTNFIVVFYQCLCCILIFHFRRGCSFINPTQKRFITYERLFVCFCLSRVTRSMRSQWVFYHNFIGVVTICIVSCALVFVLPWYIFYREGSQHCKVSRVEITIIRRSLDQPTPLCVWNIVCHSLLRSQLHLSLYYFLSSVANTYGSCLMPFHVWNCNRFWYNCFGVWFLLCTHLAVQSSSGRVVLLRFQPSFAWSSIAQFDDSSPNCPPHAFLLNVPHPTPNFLKFLTSVLKLHLRCIMYLFCISLLSRNNVVIVSSKTSRNGLLYYTRPEC